MKPLLLVLFSFFILTACEKNDLWSKQDESITSRAPQPKTKLCHISIATNTWSVISVPSNAVPGHLAHGDVVLVDNDGDGWVTATNECLPGVDCDDNNADINPGAAEVCGNELDDDCDGAIDCDDSDCEGSGSCDPCAGAGACCFCPAIPELNLTCWNGDVNNPVLWDADATYGLCSNCLEGNCGYLTPSGGFDSGSPASETCKEYLLALVEQLNLGIGPNCSAGAAPGGPSNSSSGNGNTTGFFGRK